MSNVSEKNHGKIVQVMGPVVDVEFENNDLPFIKDALEVYSEGKRLVMEVAQHIGNNTVRCIMLGASEGLCKDMDVIATGKGIQVPVGKKTLGRLFNVLGETIDGGESLEGEEHWVIHRDPPSFEEQSPVVEMLETGIKIRLFGIPMELLTSRPGLTFEACRGMYRELYGPMYQKVVSLESQE